MVAHAMPISVVPIPALLCNVCEILNVRFTFNADAVPTSWVMGTAAMLPCVARTAQDTAWHLLDADLGCSLRRDEGALFGLRAAVPPVTGNLADIVRGLMFIHSARTLYGLRRDAVIDVTQVFNMFEREFRPYLDRLGADETGGIVWPRPSRPNSIA